MTRKCHWCCRCLCVSLICTANLLGGCGHSGDQNSLDDQAIEENNRGVGLMGYFDYEAARRIFQQLHEKYPRQADIEVNLAIALMNRQQGDDEAQALKEFEAVATTHPENVRAGYCAGLLEFRRGELANAARYFKAVLASDPQDAYTAYFLAESLQQKGDRETAIQWYQRALQNDPYMRSADYALSRLYRLRGNHDAARESLAR